MDTETFLLARKNVMARLAHRRDLALEAAAQSHDHNGGPFSSGIPFWMRMLFNLVMPKRFGSFWPQALLTAAPVVFSVAKSVTNKIRGPEKESGIFSFLPLVKSLLKRYN